MDNLLIRDKTEIRKEVGKRISRLTDAEKLSAAQKVRDLIVRLKEFIKAKTVMVYLAKADEVDTAPIAEQARADGKGLIVPVVNGSEILPCELEDRLEASDLGVLEPVTRKMVNKDNIDLVIVPGRAFSASGGRIGRGKGFYDRFLTSLSNSVPTIGICFSCQLFPSLPVSERDRPVSAVISA